MSKDTLSDVAAVCLAANNAGRLRDETIRLVYAAGFSIRAIAEAAGLSPARVHQIIHGR